MAILMPYQSSLTDRSCCCVGLSQARHDMLQPFAWAPAPYRPQDCPLPFISREGVLPDSRCHRSCKHRPLRWWSEEAWPCLGDRAV